MSKEVKTGEVKVMAEEKPAAQEEARALEVTPSVTPEWVNVAMSEKTDVLDPVKWAQTRLIATNAIKAGAVPQGIRNAEQLMMIIQAGKEVGWEPVRSMKSFYIVNGLINMYGAAVGSRLREFGYVIRQYEEKLDQSCTATVEKIDGSEKYVETYTFEAAKKSGYANDTKPAWKPGAARQRKLRYGALSLIIHTYIPDALGSAAGIVEFSEDIQVQEVEKPNPKPASVSEEARSIAAQAIQQRGEGGK